MSVYPKARFLTSADFPAGFPEDAGAEVAFAGRSNVGKSSAINAIVQRRDFARTSRTPGRTQLLNFFELLPARRIVDLPGYGYAKVPPRLRERWGRLIEAYFSGRRSLAGLFVVMDSRRGLTDLDRQMLDYALAVDRPVRILLSKADKLARSQALEAERAVRAAIEGRASVQLFSAVSGQGVDAARAALQKMLAGPG